MEHIEFSQLFSRHGSYSLPVLVELKHPVNPGIWCFTNNLDDIVWDDKLYKAVPMSYRFPGSRDGVPTGGTLEIDIEQHQTLGSGEGYELLRWFDLADDNAAIEIVAIINDDGNITKVGQFHQKHGTVNWDGEKITWALGGDDRMEMQINPWDVWFASVRFDDSPELKSRPLSS